VASLTLTATLAMMVAVPLSDKFGRRKVLQWSAVLFAVSALGSAIAPNFLLLVIARMVGGLGVGVSLILAPMYIAEIAPPDMRGRLFSFNQLNIFIGISAVFFSNYLILQLAASDLAWANSLGFEKWNWRWMLEVELLPALFYFIGVVYPNDVSFKQAFRASLEGSEALTFESEAITATITMNPTLILMRILGFVASFFNSIGPVMWVLFSELFPIHIKGAAISFVGFINSLVSYLVQKFSP
jgi:MFS family permease